jgi:PAP2 superfamily protein
MLSVKFTWLEAAIATGLVLAVAAAAALARRRSGSPRLTLIAMFAREAGMLLGLFALWTYAGSKSEVSLAEAMHRAAWIWHAERDVGLPSEQALQQVFLPHPVLVQALNWYYAVLHFPVLIGCLVWLFVRHRGDYWRVRTLVLVFTAVSLLVQFIPVAPPRLLPLTGMTDTGLIYGQSVYGAHGGIDADQLSAMPSIHIGWALLVALVVVATARSRWRWLALAYPVLTTLAVVVTANHFWLDGIAAAAVLALALWVQRAAGPAYRALAGAIRRSSPATAAAVMADAPEMVPVGAMTAHAGAERGVPAAAGARGALEPGQSPDEMQAASGAHARAHDGSRPCAARAVRARVTSRNRPGRRPQSGHAAPSHDQDGR